MISHWLDCSALQQYNQIAMSALCRRMPYWRLTTLSQTVLQTLSRKKISLWNIASFRTYFFPPSIFPSTFTFLFGRFSFSRIWRDYHYHYMIIRLTHILSTCLQMKIASFFSTWSSHRGNFYTWLCFLQSSYQCDIP